MSSFDKKTYILFTNQMNKEMVDEYREKIKRWFYKTTELPKKKIVVITDDNIPNEYIYIIGYRDDESHWSILAKISVTDEGPKNKFKH